MRVKDQAGRWVEVPASAVRIVSLVPSQTELLVHLGLEERLAGVTKFCIHPQSIRQSKTVVGGTKKVNYDKIVALKPELIVANKEENTLEMVLELEKIAPVWVSDVADYQDALAMIQQLGDLLGVSEQATALCHTIDQSRSRFAAGMPEKAVKVAYLIWNDPLMAAGKHTFIDSMLQLSGFENVLSDTRYPEVDKDILSKAEVLLLSSEPFPFKEKHVLQLEKRFGVKCLLVEGDYFSWYGSRMASAFEYFNAVHRQLA